jgi:hypothetical protein
MTIRATLRKKMRLVNLMTALGFVAFPASLILSFVFESRFWDFASFAALGLVVFAMGYLFLGIRCPHCQNRVGYNLNGLTSCFKSQKVVKYCPFCATDLDTELHDPAA